MKSRLNDTDGGVRAEVGQPRKQLLAVRYPRYKTPLLSESPPF